MNEKPGNLHKTEINCPPNLFGGTVYFSGSFIVYELESIPNP